MGKKNRWHKKKTSLTRSLRLEGLERRDLLAADLVPFDGTDANLYQIHGNSGDQGQLSIIDLSNESYTDIGENQGYKVNATGYRAEDNLIYGIRVTTRELVRIDANGQLENLGSVQGLPNSNHFSADFGGDGLLYIWSKTKLYGINVDTQTVDREVDLSRRTGTTPDLAFDPDTGLMYGVEAAGKLRKFIAIDHDSGTVTTINDNFTPNKGVYGAMFADATGRIFAANNRGGLYEVDKTTGIATFVAHTPAASSNDGNAPNTAVFNLPPAMQDSLTNVTEGSSGNTMTISTPFDPEGDAISISVSALPNVGTVRLADGSALSNGDTLTLEQLNGLTYDAPETQQAVTDLEFELSDGNSTSQGRASILVSGKAIITGIVEVLHGDDDDTYGAYVFNNVITLSGTDLDGNEVSRTTNSDQNGYYEFTDVTPGTYTVSQSQPAVVHDGSSDAGELGGDAGSNEIANIVVPLGGGTYAGYDFTELAPSSLSGFTYIDSDADGSLHSLDAGVKSVAVFLTGVDDRGAPVSATTNTGAFGLYEFTGLRPGDYTITQEQPEDYLDRNSSAGSLGGTNSVNVLSAIELDPGLDGQHYDFGEVRPSSLGGHVYFDNDLDKIFDLGDIGIQDVTVTLTGTDILGNEVLATAQTDVDGKYRFSGLMPGEYVITETQPDSEQIQDSRENVGVFRGQPSTIARNGFAGQDVFEEIIVRQGEVGNDYDFTEAYSFNYAGQGGETFTNILELQGTEGDDVFIFLPGESVLEVQLNGQSTYLDASEVHQITFVGNGGNDRATLTGTEGIEKVTLRENSGSLHSGKFHVRVFQTEEIVAYNGGGYDRAFLHDSSGDDRLKATQDYVRLTGDGFENKAVGFHRTYTYSTEGDDRAYFHDSKYDDTFKSADGLARMIGMKYYNVALGFSRAYAYANTGGTDTAMFWDTSADGDVFEASEFQARMYNDSHFAQAEGFEKISAYAIVGGENDRAYLTGTDGDEILVSSPAKSGLTGDNVDFTVESFERVYATASGGEDLAYLYDSLLDDNFVAYPDHARLYNDDYFLRADGWDQVDAYSSGGGTDRAYFFDSAGDDTLIALENETRMYGVGFDNTSHGFARSYAWSENGGADTAHLFDTDFADTLKVNGPSTRMYGAGYYNFVEGFDTVNTRFSDVSNQDRAVVFGQIGTETIESTGSLSSIMYEGSATYVENADIIYNGIGEDSADDGNFEGVSDDFAFVPEKMG